jgi:hypothetical protein
MSQETNWIATSGTIPWFVPSSAGNVLSTRLPAAFSAEHLRPCMACFSMTPSSFRKYEIFNKSRAAHLEEGTDNKTREYIVNPEYMILQPLTSSFGGKVVVAGQTCSRFKAEQVGCHGRVPGI